MVHRDEGFISVFFLIINEFIQVRFPLLDEFKVKFVVRSVGEKGEINGQKRYCCLGYHPLQLQDVEYG